MQYRISDELIGWLYEMLVIRHAFLAFETGGAHPCSPRRAVGAGVSRRVV